MKCQETKGLKYEHGDYNSEIYDYFISAILPNEETEWMFIGEKSKYLQPM